MPVTITAVIGIGPFTPGPGGSSIPSAFNVTGIASSCERVRVSTTCSKAPVEVDVKNGLWNVNLPNDNGCPCGDKIMVGVQCIIGDGSSHSINLNSIPCDEPTTTTTTTDKPTTTTTTTSPPTCPTVTVDSPDVSSTCVNGKRTVTLTCHVTQPGGQNAFLQWDYGDGSLGLGFFVTGSTPAGGHSDTHDYLPGTYTARLMILFPPNCPPVPPVQVDVAPCPTTTTVSSTSTTTSTTTPTTTSTTTAVPTTSVPTTPPTTPTTPVPTTTGTTGPPSGGGGLGCICTLLVIIMLAFIAVSSISFMAWGCSGFISPGLLTLAISTAIIGIVILIIWILLCRDCPAIRVLINTFTALVAAMPIVAVVLALLGMFGCAAGALACWILFAIILVILLVSGRSLGCMTGGGP